MGKDKFTIMPFSRERAVIVDALAVGAQRHIVHGLVEIDVTRVRAWMRDHKTETGESFSFTAFLVACLAQTIVEHKYVQAYRDWRNRLIVFDDVDVVTLIEAKAGGVAIPHIVRAANRKSFRAIHDELRAVQQRPARSAQRSGRLMRLGLYVPSFLRRWFFQIAARNPQWLKRTSGTTLVTSIGMFARTTGWGIGIVPLHTLALTVGSVSAKPGIVEGRIEAREYLDVTLSFDHDIVDGAPAARFARAFGERVERADGLDL
ncbi:MAG: 2-oxo acid dehydrogenase subunit E2 [Chloroflexi bacterium]|nr:2-oxo acid dehydrogenase subunit E2 [Chloroflexota bacterium]